MPDGEQKATREIKIDKLLLTGPGGRPRGAVWGSHGKARQRWREEHVWGRTWELGFIRIRGCGAWGS